MTLSSELAGPSPAKCGAVCKSLHMPTNLAIDDALLEEALLVGGHRTKKATVTEALVEYIRRRRQAKVIEAFGTIELEPAFDHKALRRRR
jgi:Arc/MetJ family transcription regulator